MGQHQIAVEQICNQLYIDAAIDTVYDYVTQPDRWHEWHPTSLRAETGIGGSLPTGHRFTEVIDLLGLQIPMSYRVLIAHRPNEFKTVFSSAPVDGSVRYQLHRCGSGTLFKRTLLYSTQMKLGGLRQRMVECSNTAMGNLKKRLESASA
ncbi:SRPBCC family protein [Pseudomonas fluorescens]|uniref:Polyketide cyclase n=1 Tax=Pseudomonas fluorescens TaxID=294 RepID=A0A5E7BJV0_PSEFL|nr:SRPBCC family protein [Pseudomonas fluorescens]VVN89747.1 hypothetical protein PS691_01769 [Pseudomonas fluorescens]